MPTTTVSPTTELEAVNQLLSVIGEPPVNSFDYEGVPSVSIARDEIKRVTRQVQAAGLNFNSEEVELQPDENDHVYLPEGTYAVKPVDRTRNIVWRGDRLYDKDNNTDLFTEPVKMRLTRGFDFQDAPEHVRQYIVVKAGRIFQDRMVGSKELHQFNKDDEMEARIRMYRMENTDMEILREVTYEVLSEGFYFNTDYNYKLEPNESKEIDVPEDVLAIKPTYGYKEFVPRKGKLYDRYSQTFTFKSPVRANIVWLFPYNEVPEHVRHYIYILATLRFERQIGLPQEMHSYSEESFVRARANMLSEEANLARSNFLSCSTGTTGTSHRFI